jgi:nucleotide-sensitive chloride channel 1A
MLQQQQQPSMRCYVPCNDINEPEMWENEEVDFKLNEVEISFLNDGNVGFIGTLYITTKRIIWISEIKAYDFDVTFITLHAITRDPDSYPRPCIYCQFDSEQEIGDNTYDELFFVPKSESQLTLIFDALSRAAQLNPDESDNCEYDSDLIYNLEEVQLGASQINTLNHLDSVMNFTNNLSNSEF